MTTTIENTAELRNNTILPAWPVDAQAAALALETAFPPLVDRRRASRVKHRTAAAFVADDQHPEAPAKALYTRDANPWQMGFITATPLRVGQRGFVEMTLPTGQTVCIECTVRRCRSFLDGWYEGAMHFRQEQPTLIAA